MIDQQSSALPLTRMATINKPFFWIYLTIATGVYIYDKLNNLDPFDSGLIIIGSVFIALFLELITQSIKSDRAYLASKVVTYVFEIATTAIFIFNSVWGLNHRG